jgi:hypothetical protein
MLPISTEDLILAKLIEFYRTDDNLDYVIQIVNQNTNVSLRLLDWLVTNYAKGSGENDGFSYNITGETKDGAELASDRFDVYTEYKNQLKAYNKKYFDPFARKERIYFFKDPTKMPIKLTAAECKEYKKRDDGLVSTIAQLHFFMWSITNKVIIHAAAKAELIEKDMLDAAKLRNTIVKDIDNDKTADKDKPKRKHKRVLSKISHHSRSSHKEVYVAFT